jgi:hypothetical protein
MKLKQLFFVAIALIAFASCNRRNNYQQETCSSSAALARTVDSRSLPTENPKNANNSHWQVIQYQRDSGFIRLMYVGDPFTALCVSEIQGMKVNIKGAFMDAKAFIKPTIKDSFQVPLNNIDTQINSNQTIYEWWGSYTTLDLTPYYMHYPGTMWPVVYIKIPYTYPMDDRGWAYDELAKDFRDFTFKPLGQKF